MPKKGRPSDFKVFRPVALTSRLMRTVERLILHIITPQVQLAQDPFQFGNQRNVGSERECISLVEDFTTWSHNTSKTKETVLDLRRRRPSPLLVNISGEEIEVVAYKYLGLQLEDKLDWSVKTEHVSAAVFLPVSSFHNTQ